MPEYHIISDCDGIFTSANIHCSTEGKRGKMFSVNDSLMIDFMQRQYCHIVDMVVLTGDTGSGLEITKGRMDYMSLNIVNCKNRNKYSYIKENFDMSKVLYFGDDIFDFAIFKECFYSATVCNAPEIVKQYATYVSPYEGGKNGLTDILFNALGHLGLDVEYDMLNYIKAQPGNTIKHSALDLHSIVG